MKRLTPPNDDPLALYDAIVGRKEDVSIRDHLRRLRAIIEAAYEQYDREKPHLENVRPLAASFSDEQKKALLHCYNSATDPLKQVRARIFRSCPETCQYCTIMIVEDLDHYLPKNDYPEFAVLPINLVPSCGTCNSPRSWRSATGKRSLIHFYYDPVPDVQLLFARVLLVDGLPQAEFYVDASECPDDLSAELYKEHVHALGLLKRYERIAATLEHGLDSIRRLVNVWGSDLSLKDVQQKITEMAQAERDFLGPNHWKVALYSGAAASIDFINYSLRGSRCA